MEDLNEILQLTESFPLQLEKMTEDCLLKLRIILWGQSAAAPTNKEDLKDMAAASPQQTKKRVKRLSSLSEDKEAEVDSENCGKSSTQKNKCSNAELLATADIVDNANTVGVNAAVATPKATIVASLNDKEEECSTTETDSRKSEATNLMPPPAALVDASVGETLNKRPTRAARLKSEKCLKEPKLTTKLRRPDEVKVKLEHEERPSQMHEVNTNIIKPKHTISLNNTAVEKGSLSSQKSDDSIIIVPGKQPSIVTVNSDLGDLSTATVCSEKKNDKEQNKLNDSSDSGIREIRIKIKREKVSLNNRDEIPEVAHPDKAVFKVPDALPLPMLVAKTETSVTEETSSASSISSSTAAPPAKKTRKKKDVVHRPIKVERFSDLDVKRSPIALRTRHGSSIKTDKQSSPPSKEPKRPDSVYEDAIEEALPSRNSKETNSATAAGGNVNETVNLGPSADATMNMGPAPGDATFCTNAAPGQTTFVMESNPNATITLKKHSGTAASADVTFDVQQNPKNGHTNKEDEAGGQRSFETAKDSSLPNDNSLLTEDEQEKPVEVKPKITSASIKAKASGSAKAVYKIPARHHELFNPLAQSPVKMRVEAFENAAAAATEQSKRPLRSRKENTTPTSVTTPVMGKLTAPTLGRFLTPTQNSNIGNVSSAYAKKATTSASKAIPLPKSANAVSLLRSNSTASSKTLQRENSADDFRKGLHNLAEERKKQREQKHLLAAQQREAKERERAERISKLAKEREEKRLLKKQQEQEQKKRELEEIQRKLRQQQEEEAAKLKAAKEREMLLQMKQQQQQLAKQKMLPPPPKIASKYTFEMLHEDDSTDDEDKVSFKRPPAPSWSRSHVRGPVVLKQEYTPSAYIDSFFSVQPMTPDLKIIFPNIDARHLKRNSSVLWSTPPRYSELPKY